MSTLKDTSAMPFGKHKGEKMANVPASYLLWLFENDKCNKEVREYVLINMDVLKKEANKK